MRPRKRPWCVRGVALRVVFVFLYSAPQTIFCDPAANEDLIMRNPLRAVLTLLFWSTLGLAIVNYGAVELTVLSFYALASALLLSATVIVFGLPDCTVSSYRWVLGLCVVSVLLVSFQTLPLPAELWIRPAWREVRSLGFGSSAVISLTPFDDWPALLHLLAPLLTFLLALKLFDSDHRALFALRLLAVFGAIVSFASIMQFNLAPDTLLLIEKKAYLDSLTGFFVNRNTAATFFGIVTLLNLSMLSYTLAVTGWRQIWLAMEHRHRLMRDQRQNIVWFVIVLSGTLLAIVALMLTKSRAGIGSSMAAIAFLIVAAVTRPTPEVRGGHAFRAGSSNLGKAVKATVVAVVAILLIALIGGRTLLRVEQQGLEDGRFCVFQGIASAIIDYLPLGAGLASFEAVFPGYRDSSCGIKGVWDMAHNVYLETLFALGVPGLALLIVGLCTLVVFFLKGTRRRRRLRFVPEAGLSIIVLLLIHSIFDFSIQIPGLALFVAATLAPMVTISLGSTRRRRNTGERSGLNVQPQRLIQDDAFSLR